MPFFSLVRQPAHFASAYKPVQWGWTSQRSPVNTVPGEIAAVTLIRVATAADVTTYGGTLEVGDVFVVHGTIAVGILTVGQAISIANTVSALYSGVYHVTKIISTNVTVIDAPPASTDDTNGTIRKYYEGYRLIAKVSMENIPLPVRRVVNSDLNSEFILDVRDIAQRSFFDVFDITAPASTDIILDAAGYVTQSYTIRVYEGYMVPDANGINVFTEPAKINASNSYLHGPDIVVNSVQPYHHIDEDDQEPDLLWENDLAEYEVTQTSTSPVMRFLTYGPRGLNGSAFDPGKAQLVGTDEDMYLGFLWDDDEDIDVVLTVGSYDVDDVLIGSLVNIDFEAPRDSGILTVGPRNLGSNIDAAAHHYKVTLRIQIGVATYVAITETFCYEIDTACHVRPRRFHWLNSFGCVDGYTATGTESRENTVKRERIKKPHMAATFTTAGGDWQHRTYRTEPLRRYRIGTRTENRKMLRYLADDLVESADVRTWIYERGDDFVWTRLNLLAEAHDLGYKGGRLSLEYFMAVDNVKQLN